MLYAALAFLAIVLVAFIILIIGIVWLDENTDRKPKRKKNDNLREARENAGIPALREKLNTLISKAETEKTSIKTATALKNAETALNKAYENPTNRIDVYAAKAAIDAAARRIEA